MNVLSRRLHELENNILTFPPEDDDILLHVGDADELLLHDRAGENKCKYISTKNLRDFQTSKKLLRLQTYRIKTVAYV